MKKTTSLIFMLMFLLSNSVQAGGIEPEIIRNEINGVQTLVVLPDTYKESKKNKFVVFFHGAGGTAYDLLSKDKYHNAVLRALVWNGYIVIGSDYSSVQNWGNPKSVIETKEMIEFYKKKYNLADRPYVYMSSMGGVTALNAIAYGAINPIAVAGVFPVTNLDNMYGTGFKSSIDEAYGITDDFEHATDGYNPIEQDPTLFTKIPFKIWASNDDTVVSKKENAIAFARKVNKAKGFVQVIDTTGEHGDPSNFKPMDIIRFFVRHN